MTDLYGATIKLKRIRPKNASLKAQLLGRFVVRRMLAHSPTEASESLTYIAPVLRVSDSLVRLRSIATASASLSSLFMRASMLELAATAAIFI